MNYPAIEQSEDMAKKQSKNRPEWEVGSYRAQVRLNEDWREVIEAAAGAKGISVSEYIREAIFEALPKCSQAKLRKAPMAVGRPPNEES